MSPKSRVFLGALTIFIFGGVAGGFGSAMYSYGAPIGENKESRVVGERRHRDPQKLLKRIGEKLSLTPEQESKVKAIFERSMSKMEELRKEQFETKRALRQKIGEEIRELLTPEQQAKFDEFRKKMMEKMSHRGKRGGRHLDRRQDD